MTSISNQAVITFSFISLILASKKIPALYWAMLFSTLAVFSQSNGLLCPIIISIYFFIQFKNSINVKIKNANKKVLAQWIAFNVIMLALYFTAYTPEEGNESQISLFSEYLSFNIIIKLLASFVALLGGSLFVTKSISSFIGAFCIGLILITFILWRIRQKNISKPALLILSFLLSSIMLIVFGRSLYIGLEVAVTPRYKMYAIYLLVITVLISPKLLEIVNRSFKWKYGVLFLAISFNIYAYPSNLPYNRIIDGDLRTSFLYWIEDGDFRRAKGYFIHDTDSYLFAALKNGSYTPLSLLDPTNILNLVHEINNCPDTVADINEINVGNRVTLTHTNRNAAAIKINTNQAVSSIWLCSSKQSYHIEVPLTEIKQKHTYYLPRELITSGHYQLISEHSGILYRAPELFVKKSAVR